MPVLEDIVYPIIFVVGEVIVVLGKPIPALTVCLAVHVFAVDKETPPPPDMHVEGIEAVGKETVPALTVKPLANVGVAFTVNVFADVVPNVVFPETDNVVLVEVVVVVVPNV